MVPKGHVDITELGFKCLEKDQAGAVGWKIVGEMKLVLDNAGFNGELEFFYKPDTSKSQWGVGATTTLWCTTMKSITGTDYCTEQKETFAFNAEFATEDLVFGVEITVGGPTIEKQEGQSQPVQDFGSADACGFTQVMLTHKNLDKPIKFTTFKIESSFLDKAKGQGLGAWVLLEKQIEDMLLAQQKIPDLVNGVCHLWCTIAQIYFAAVVFPTWQCPFPGQCVFPCKWRKILRLLFKLMELCNIYYIYIYVHT